jgi:hypothetical protein
MIIIQIIYANWGPLELYKTGHLSTYSLPDTFHSKQVTVVNSGYCFHRAAIVRDFPSKKRSLRKPTQEQVDLLTCSRADFTTALTNRAN